MVSQKKKLLAGVAGFVMVSTAGAFWKLNAAVPAYEVLRVIDGDTFETKERQLIRLDGVDAPELGLCGGEEAKKELKKMVMGKPVYLKVNYRDKYMRLLSLVYTPDGFVNERMVEKGVAVYRQSGIKNDTTPLLQSAHARATSNKLGIYGKECTQITNLEKPKCLIKGNIREGGSAKIYSLPGCESYAATKVQLYYGDRWFCSENDAKKAGFVKAGGCNGK